MTIWGVAWYWWALWAMWLSIATPFAVKFGAWMGHRR